jgi:hypothetical protein
VTIYKLLDPMGPIFFEAITTLYDPHGYERQHFGRSLEVVEFFLSAGAAADILAVGTKNEVFTYFQLVQDGRDPRRR